MNERGFDEEGSFTAFFQAATGNAPFPWQDRLYKLFISGKFPSSCSLPTGLGKTSVIAIWLLALADQAENVEPHKRVPRRLVYVVNRRTIVDQATREAEKLRENIQNPELLAVRKRLDALRGGEASDTELPLAISTLRGQFADNGEWSADPARPAIIVGTVDMIGSRLLFSGYGRGFKHRPLHAGFLGQDTLLVHDEAHLEPAFQKLLDTIKDEQVRCKEFRPFHVLPLTATPRTDNGAELFGLTDADHKHVVIRRRLEAVKTITLHALDGTKQEESDNQGIDQNQPSVAKKNKKLSPSKKIVDLALQRAKENPDSAVLIFLREVPNVLEVVAALRNADDGMYQAEPLTGTMRGRERDEFVKTPVFQRFLPTSNRDGAITPAQGTVFLVCTSAGEVGVDMSANHLICDLTPFDSMAQRFGRVNRYGEGNAKIDVVHPQGFDKSGADKEYQTRREKTRDLLVKLNGNGSPKAVSSLPLPDRIAAFSPTPTILSATDILFDSWALTTIREKLPGRPPVADWLHGVPDEWQPPDTQIVWRNEVKWVTDLFVWRYSEWRNDGAPATVLSLPKAALQELEVFAEELLDDYVIKPHEQLRDRSARILKEIQKLAQGHGNEPVWIKDDDGIEATTLEGIARGDADAIAKKCLLLSPMVGGLRSGMFDGTAEFSEVLMYDVSDEWFEDKEQTKRRRRRLRDGHWPDDPEEQKQLKRMRIVRKIDFITDAGEDSSADENESEGVADNESNGGAGSTTRVMPIAENVRPPERIWQWCVLPRSADDDGSRSASKPVLLEVHINDVRGHLVRIIKALDLADTNEGRALVFAAEWHDLGKDRQIWQRSIWNAGYPELVLAKSGNHRPPRDLSSYRHEFGSLLNVLSSELAAYWTKLSNDEKELTLHFIAAHHGRGRPHFPPDEAFDPDHPSAQAGKIAREVPRRFARLQRKYGRWGLAYLESILRAADAVASANPSETVEDNVEAAAEPLATGGT